jgi:ribosomal protein S18 acetylase RimI-like enzyme
MVNRTRANQKNKGEVIKIRKATQMDAVIIADLGRMTFTETFGYLFTPEELDEYLLKTFNDKKMCDSLSKQDNIYGIAYWNDFPVGYYKLKLNSTYEEQVLSPMVQLQKIYLLKSHLDKQIGKQLMLHLLSLPEISNIDCMWLLVLDSNERALRFYEASGFNKKGKRSFQIGTRQLQYDLMTKILQ